MQLHPWVINIVNGNYEVGYWIQNLNTGLYWNGIYKAKNSLKAAALVNYLNGGSLVSMSEETINYKCMDSLISK